MRSYMVPLKVFTCERVVAEEVAFILRVKEMRKPPGKNLDG